MDEFNTIFVFTDKARAVWPGFEMLILGLLVIIATSIWAFYSLWLIVSKNNFKRITHIVLAVISIYGGSGWAKQGYEENQYYQNEFSRLQRLYDSHTYGTVQGIVHIVRIEPYGKQDLIQIDGIDFEVSCYDSMLFTYSKASACGGALTEGVYARVFYYEYVSHFSTPVHYPEILRVDVKK